MDYKEKYEQALERARQFSEKPYLEDSAGIVEYIFPELAESEDERIRKALLEMVHDTTGDELWVDYDVHKEEALAWLEKQGEQKPYNHVQWSDEEELHIKELESLVKKVWAIAEHENDKDTIREMRDLSFFLKTLNPEKRDEQKPEWSDEDINKIDTIIGYIASSAGEKLGILLPCINWLKSLKDRVQPKQEWSKEDEEQLSFCCAAIELSNYSSDEYRNYAISFLESLKDKYTWKPSESDILLLERIANGESNPQNFQASLVGLIGQLKKLMEK